MLPELDVRLVGASTLSLDRAIAERRMLPDLAREFSDCQVRLPALRERREELPILSRHFMHRLARRYSLPPRDISHSVYEAWQAHHWPGNLQELEDSVKRYLVAGEKDAAPEMPTDRKPEGNEFISPGAKENGHYPPASLAAIHAGARPYKSLRSLLRSVKEEAERSAIARALEETGWNRKAAARLLKTSYRTVLYKIEQYQMSASESSPVSNGRALGSAKPDAQGRNGRDRAHFDSASPRM